jgi:hypothetical protein
MRKKYGLPVLAGMLVAILTGATSSLHAEPYELSKNDVMESKEISSATVSLFGVKLGDSEAKALDVLVNEKIAGIKAGSGLYFSDRSAETHRSNGWRPRPGWKSRPHFYQ